jgi:quinol-cytochrome oxidoreductase complex cytochrome b subunit
VVVVLTLESLRNSIQQSNPEPNSEWSSNPAGPPSDYDKIPFHPYFSTKDIVGWVVLVMSFGYTNKMLLMRVNII